MASPIWISHRGYCLEAEENTAEAFRVARSLGFLHLETDLRTTADGHIVLAHDATLERLSGTTHRIEASPRLLLEQVQLRGKARLVFFDQFLEEFTQSHWIFDIKPESALRTIDTLLHWWRQPGYRDFFSQRVRFLFWDKSHQDYLLRYQPAARCMARVEQCRRAGIACALGMPSLAGIEPGVSYSLPPRIGGINLMQPSILSRYRRHGANVLAYLPATEADTRLALKAGVDEILTDGPILTA
ncbi:glycerophosphodiester phosphodiesterase family protein [Marinimicrobium sp. ABcell2]|nr:glycerophosphodiester phosphodiesterase family protein [Marinimicrobium sp. ABcell2]MDQ2076332.1 glycerophosphodiester phosphodiesterase family protein [Marinimicrobium sp. ABcell2]